MRIDFGQIVMIVMNLFLVFGAVWKVSALLQGIKSELVHVNEKLDGLDRRVIEVENRRR